MCRKTGEIKAMAEQNEKAVTEFDKLQATRKLSKGIEELTIAIYALVDAYNGNNEDVENNLDMSGKPIKFNT